MSNEKTPLLKGIIIDIPLLKKEINNNDDFFDKTRSLSLEELLHYQNDPWWQNLRKTFLLSFWIFLSLIFSLACCLVVLQYDDSCGIRNVIINTTTMRTTTNFTIVVGTSESALLLSSANYRNTTSGARNLSRINIIDDDSSANSSQIGNDHSNQYSVILKNNFRNIIKSILKIKNFVNKI